MTCLRVSRAAWKVSSSKGVSQVQQRVSHYIVLQECPTKVPSTEYCKTEKVWKKNTGVSCKSVRKDLGRHAVFQRDGKQWRWLYFPRYLNLHAKVLFQNLTELCSWRCSLRYGQGMEMFQKICYTYICASSDTVGAPIKNMIMKWWKTNIRIWGCSRALTMTRGSVWHFWCHDVWLPAGCVCFAGRSITCITLMPVQDESSCKIGEDPLALQSEWEHRKRTQNHGSAENVHVEHQIVIHWPGESPTCVEGTLSKDRKQARNSCINMFPENPVTGDGQKKRYKPRGRRLSSEFIIQTISS
jgi:hypothetical protein